MWHTSPSISSYASDMGSDRASTYTPLLSNTRPLTVPAIVYRCIYHYDDVIMDAIASQITSLTIVYSTVYSDADQRKHQSSASLAFVWRIHRWPVNSPQKWPVTRKMFPFDDVIMILIIGHPARQPLLGLESWYFFMLSRLFNSSEDRASVDFIYGCPIFKQVQWHDSRIGHKY